MNECVNSVVLALSCVLPLLGQETTASNAVDNLAGYLNADDSVWRVIPNQPFAGIPLTKDEAVSARQLLLSFRRKQLRHERADEMKSLEIEYGDVKMPLYYEVFGDKPESGRSLFISMHGGGGAPKRVNDRQWNNQKRLYKPAEGVYVAPRAPTDTWNLWHQQHIMPMFDRLIENMILFEDVNPNRVYVMGYSAGGDGVYQLAPRMADRWAAAAMMAGHPNDAKPQNLRNIGFAIYMGGKDGAYNRNKVAAEWGDKLDALQAADPSGYRHLVTIYPDKGHWMGGEDASSLPWMSKFARNPFPERVVWRKDQNRQPRFYWVGADTETWKAGELLSIERKGQAVTLSQNTTGLLLYLNDQLIDLDKKIIVTWEQANRTTVQPQRTISAIHKSLTQRFDPTTVFTSIIDCNEL